MRPRDTLILDVGALLRWDELKDRGFAPDGTFGLAAIEDYEREHHPDATIENGRVERDRFTGEMIVYERWTPLTDKVTYCPISDQSSLLVD